MMDSPQTVLFCASHRLNVSSCCLPPSVRNIPLCTCFTVQLGNKAVPYIPCAVL